MKNLNVVLVQSDLSWENPVKNREHFESHFLKIDSSTDVVVLCEMFTTGFTMNAKEAAEVHHPEQMETLNWMRAWAKKLDAVITGSVTVKEDDRYYNRLYWVLPDGRFNTYDKRHTFTFAGEDKSYSNGQGRIIEEWRGWKICPLICYDLRFPVWSRNGIVEGEPQYDVLIYVANWPEVRREPWNKLLLARAIENQCYVLAVNRVGVDENANGYSGDSAVIGPRGEYIVEPVMSVEQTISATLSAEALIDFRKKFPVLMDADGFDLHSTR
jgi:omega-amidase